MKPQIIRRTCLTLIAALLVINNDKSINFQQPLKINHSILNIHSINTPSYSANTFCLKTFCGRCINVKEHDTPEIPEPDGDHEFHSFTCTHPDKRTFWGIIAGKIFTLITLLYSSLIFLVKVSMISRLQHL